ncbi:hypothetical protein IHN32_04490 [Deinococcus sp. 14RED07]|uniref:hypothetical protein n=1 Tax=Deinococcus sp. 14RED07 TaxID=2745874 RepID=UPI001E5D86B4|nr:hypothetical protein [Deinococcus sp. 14RED07]MCD0175206.1 hypothetical protein [Deinococcus sp. 14RED07]
MFLSSNSATAILAGNMVQEGRIAFFDPINGFTGITWANMGLFPEDAVVFPDSEVTREAVRARNPEGGAPIVVDERITDTTITYELPILTPDATVRALHNGAPAVEMTAASMVGISVSPFNPGASVLGRFIMLAKIPGTDPARLCRLFWHPRAALQSNGVGDSQGSPTLLFNLSVRAFTYTPGVDFTDVAAQITPYGAIFNVPFNKIAGLLDKLDAEAVAV